jgi:hypothetical protein
MELSAELSLDSLEALENALNALGDGIESGAERGSLALATEAMNVAKAACPTDTGGLAASIHTERTESGYDVVASAPYAAFVEFGTGIGTPSGDQFDAKAMSGAGYEVNASGKGEEGWVYPKNGEFHLTHGQSGKGFMAAGAEAIRDEAASVMLSYVMGASK